MSKFSHAEEVGGKAVTSAYNFVPLSNNVVRPDWQDLVSQDLPLQDGVCAELAVQIEAHTPILVGGPRAKKGNLNQVKFFVHPDQTPAIPGSSLRGMIRNVVETASFSRMGIMDDRALSIRDLDLPAYRNHLTRQNGFSFETKVRGGWLKFDAAASKWTIQECRVGRVEQEELRKIKDSTDPSRNLYQNLTERFKNAPNEDAKRLARLKYEAIAGRVSWPFKSVEGREHSHRQGKIKLVYEKWLIANQKMGPDIGQAYLVMTGQPGALRDPNGDPNKSVKHMEFAFATLTDKPELGVPDSVMADFRAIYAESKDLQFLESDESPHRKRGIPVFFLTSRVGDSKREVVTCLGLSQMFRLPGEKSLGAMRDQKHPPHARMDFAETLFGHVREDRDGLKSRVMFGDCRLLLASGQKPALAAERFQKETVLAAPKPTFYPNYLEQKDEGGTVLPGDYATILSPKADLRGWKRYPVRPLQEVELNTPPAPGQASNSILEPLKEGSVFKGTVRLHNVNPIELGAIVWALTWGGNAQLRHALGMGKPFGMGQVSIKVQGTLRSNDPDATPPTLEECVTAFTSYMDAQLGRDWLASEPMVELLAMANPSLPQANKQVLKPLKLTVKPNLNEFRDVKRTGVKSVLRRYSKLG